MSPGSDALPGGCSGDGHSQQEAQREDLQLLLRISSGTAHLGGEILSALPTGQGSSTLHVL
jgi:hypothetical protein